MKVGSLWLLIALFQSGQVPLVFFLISLYTMVYSDALAVKPLLVILTFNEPVAGPQTASITFTKLNSGLS